MKVKVTTVLLAFCMMLSVFAVSNDTAYATSTKTDLFVDVPALTGDGATDMVNIAIAQIGNYQLSRESYGEGWCADFVSDCAILADRGFAVPKWGSVEGLKDRIIAAGGDVVESPQAGDLVFYYHNCESKWCHVGIMISENNSIQGNVSNQVKEMAPDKYCADSNGCKDYDIVYVRPDYDEVPLSECSISLKTTKYTYTGYYKKPLATVKYGSEVLEQDVDYEIIYSNNKKCGQARAVIKGLGRYQGEVTKTYTIKPAKGYITKATAGSKKITVKIRSQSASGVSGYQVYYKKSGSSAKYAYTTSTSKVLTKLVKGKKYTVKVRAYKYINGEKVYGSYSTAKYVTVK